MCRQTTCRKCGKASWSGCGEHVNQVMKGIPKAQQCQGHKMILKSQDSFLNYLERRFKYVQRSQM